MRALDVFVGDVARARIAEHGWDPSLFSLLLGASGGPKWLVLSQMDRVLAAQFLSKRETPLHAFGTSIGSWRHACLAQDDPFEAIGLLEQHYIHQAYTAKPSPAEVTAGSQQILDAVFGMDGEKPRQVVESQRLISHIGINRGRGPLAVEEKAVQALGLGLAALSNAAHRKLFQLWYQRVIYSAQGDLGESGMHFEDFQTVRAQLSTKNLKDALLASGSIPLTLRGVRDPEGAPRGLYWDGGIVDYHHDLSAYEGEGLVLYPHFFGHIVPGWFDKPFRDRWPSGSALDRVVLLSPSAEFVATLPGQRVPDRKDFLRYDDETRFANWLSIVDRCEALASELTDLLEQSDPLANVKPFPSAA